MICFPYSINLTVFFDLFSDVSFFLITLHKVIGGHALTARSYCHCVTGQSTFHTQTTTTHCKK